MRLEEGNWWRKEWWGGQGPFFLSRPWGETDRAKRGGTVFCSYWLTGWAYGSLRSVLFEVISSTYFGHLFIACALPVTADRLGSRTWWWFSICPWKTWLDMSVLISMLDFFLLTLFAASYSSPCDLTVYGRAPIRTTIFFPGVFVVCTEAPVGILTAGSCLLLVKNVGF